RAAGERGGAGAARRGEAPPPSRRHRRGDPRPRPGEGGAARRVVVSEAALVAPGALAKRVRARPKGACEKQNFRLTLGDRCLKWLVSSRANYGQLLGVAGSCAHR